MSPTSYDAHTIDLGSTDGLDPRRVLLYVAQEWMMVYSMNTVMYHLLGVSRILSTVHIISILENY